MTQRILIMGLPGAGKTTLAQALLRYFPVQSTLWLNADAVRGQFNDWDFSAEGRIRQSQRMRELADAYTGDYAVADFVAPLHTQREIFGAHHTVWVDTISQSRYADTNAVFEAPVIYNFRVTEQAADKWASLIAENILGTK